MPYRRLPKTDASRLKALKTLLDNDSLYTVNGRFIDWKTMNAVQPAYNQLKTAVDQYALQLQVQTRRAPYVEKPQRKAMMYVGHFIQVLLMAVERGEIRKTQLKLYGLEETATALPANLKSVEGLLDWGPKIIEGEKKRLLQGGRAIYNPTIGMVSTHFHILNDAYQKQLRYKKKTQMALEKVQELRPKVDEIILELWNQIEAHFQNEPPEVRFEQCRKCGVIYYYRRNEEHLY